MGTNQSELALAQMKWMSAISNCCPCTCSYWLDTNLRRKEWSFYHYMVKKEITFSEASLLFTFSFIIITINAKQLYFVINSNKSLPTKYVIRLHPVHCITICFFLLYNLLFIRFCWCLCMSWACTLRVYCFLILTYHVMLHIGFYHKILHGENIWPPLLHSFQTHTVQK